MNEHELEPTPGLPERLPEGERILWQGAPSWQALALRALHARKVAIYFGLLAAWHVADSLHGGAGWSLALSGSLWLVVLGALTSGLLTLLGWAIARSTMYTLTTSRLVLRFGVALPMAMNLPFRVIESAGLVLHRDGTADLPLALIPGQRIGYFITWPHVRPWHLLRSQPTLRVVPDGRRVAELLAAALRASEPGAAVTNASLASVPRAPVTRPTLTAA